MRKIDLVGKVFGQLTVIRRGERVKRNQTWVCGCSCGNVINVYKSTFTRNNPKCNECHRKKSPYSPGTRFGHLTILRRADNYSPGATKSICKCDCGREVIKRHTTLSHGSTSCGCDKSRWQRSPMKVGQRFGKLVVVSRAPPPEGVNNRGAYWLCRCDCGKEKVILGWRLWSKLRICNSCGCDKRKGRASKIVNGSCDGEIKKLVTKE